MEKRKEGSKGVYQNPDNILYQDIGLKRFERRNDEYQKV